MFGFKDKKTHLVSEANLVIGVHYLLHTRRSSPHTWCRCTPAEGGWGGRAVKVQTKITG